jgi:hypothetical protein
VPRHAVRFRKRITDLVAGEVFENLGPEVPLIERARHDVQQNRLDGDRCASFGASFSGPAPGRD